MLTISRAPHRYNLDLEEGIIPDSNSNKAVTFESFARDIWLKKKATEVNPKSLARYSAVIDNFLYFLVKEKGLEVPLLTSVTYEIGADYISHRAHTPLMPNGSRKFTRNFKEGASKMTLHYERGRLYQIYQEALKRNLVNENPFSDVIAKKPNKDEVKSLHRPLTVEEEKSLLKAALAVDNNKVNKGNLNFYDILLFFLRTGMRENELRHLEWTDIDWGRDLIHINRKTVTETQTVPIPDNLIQGIKKRVKGKSPEDSVFSRDNNLGSIGARLHIRGSKVLKRLQVKDINFSNNRITTQHTFQWKPKGTNGSVPMCNTVIDMLNTLKANSKSNFIFPHWDGGICRIKLLPLLKKAQALAGITGRLRVHDLRHTLAIRLRGKGVALETIMGVLRHADIKETLIYAPYHIEEGRSAMSKLDID